MIPRRSEIWWGETAGVGGRPYLVLTRDRAIPVLPRILVAPITRTVRGLASELSLGADDGLTVECVAAFDNVRTFSRQLLVRRLGVLAAGRQHEICSAMAAAIDC